MEPAPADALPAWRRRRHQLAAAALAVGAVKLLGNGTTSGSPGSPGSQGGRSGSDGWTDERSGSPTAAGSNGRAASTPSPRGGGRDSLALPGPALRFNVVFAMDLSASMAGRRLDAAKACVDRLVSTALHPADGVGIVGFHSTVAVVLPLTPLAGADVPSVLRSLGTGRQTCLWDAVLDALELLEGAEPDAMVHSELVRCASG